MAASRRGKQPVLRQGLEPLVSRIAAYVAQPMAAYLFRNLSLQCTNGQLQTVEGR